MGSRFWSYTSQVFVAALALAVFGGLTKPADAYQIKRVLRTSVSMSTSEEVKPVDLSGLTGFNADPLDLTKSFVLITSSINLANQTRVRADVYATIDDPSTVLLVRNTSSTANNVEIMVVEFASGVTVQSGITLIPDQGASGTVKNVVLPSAVTLNHSFVIIGNKSATSGGGLDYRNLFTAELTTTTNLRITRSQLAANYNEEVGYQVVSFDPTDADVNVQHGGPAVGTALTIANGSTTGTATLTSVDTTKSILFFTTSPDTSTGGIEEQYMVDGTLTNATTLTFTRAVGTNTVSVSWYLVEFKDTAFSQKGRVTFATAANATTVGSTDLLRTFAVASASGTGSGGAGDTSGLDETLVRAQQTTATNLQLTREPSGTIPNVTVSYFTMELPPLHVTSPNGNEVWKVGETHNITWDRAKQLDSGGTCTSGAGPGHKLKIEGSINSGGAWPMSITTDVCANLGTYAWTIPDTVSSTNVIGTALRIKITDQDYVATTRNFDTSNADFTIKGTITVTAPNGAESWVVNSANNITWTNTGDHSTNKVNILLSTNSGSTFPLTIINGAGAPTVESGTYAWTIPDSISSTFLIGSTLRVRVQSQADTTVQDDSNADFTIKGTVTVTYPDASGITLQTLSSYNITWNTNGTFQPQAKVNIYYTTDNVSFTPIISGQSQGTGGASGSGSYTWPSVPSGAVSSTVKVKVEDYNNSGVNDLSDNTFTVVPSIVVDTPAGGEGWVASTPHNILWHTNGAGLANVKIEYSTNGGGAYSTIIENDGTPNDGIVTNNGTLSWDVPDVITNNNVIIRISNPSNAAIFGVCPTFSIRGQTQISVPNGGENWPIGGSRTIQWNNLGTFSGTVELRYSKNGGSDGFPGGQIIATGLANSGSSGSYSWNPIPDVATGYNSTMQVKAIPSDSTNELSDTSDANFTVAGTLTLTSPNGGESWVYGGAAHNITWTKTGSLVSVELQLSTDSGSSWGAPFATALDPVSGTPYSWTIPNNLSDTVRIQVREVSHNAISDMSDANFAIKGSLTLTAPNGAEMWAVSDTARNITWTRSGTTGAMTGNVDIHYSTDGGGNYGGTITTNSVLASALSYNWNPIPAAAQSNTEKIRIRLSGDTSTSDVSDAIFFVKPKLAVTAPNGAENLIVGGSQNITWSTSGTVANVNVYYSTDSGGTYPGSPNVATNITNVGAFSWTIADAITSQGRVKVEDASDATNVKDQSDADFNIKGSLTLTAPNGGESWVVGTSQNVTWTKTGTLSGNVKLYYSTNGGSTYNGDPASPFATVPVTDLSYGWTIPDAIGTQLKVKIVYANDTNVFDESNANFTVKGSLTLTAPDGGEVWPAGQTRTVTWSKSGTLANVKLEYGTDGGSTYPTVVVGSVAASTLSYDWAIPGNVALTTTGRIKITLLSDSTVNDASNNDFRVRGDVALTAPNGGETWVVGATQNVTWTITGSIANVKLEYSTDAGNNYLAGGLITNSTAAAAGSYPWTVGDAIGSLVRVRVSDASDAAVNDASNANFTIKGSLAITAPNGGQSWVVGTSQNITWTKTGSIANVKLEYSTDSGSTYPGGGQVIIASTPGGNLSYAWTIPDAIGTSLRVKVSDLGTVPADPDESNADFGIKGSITLTAPNGSEQWGIGTGQSITWTKGGTLTGNLKLELSRDAGSSWLAGDVITSTAPASGASYSWTVPDAPTVQARVRVTQLDDTSVTDASDANFRIKGSLTLTAPNGSENWKVGESRNVTWTRGGSIANVKLDYSTDSGATFPGVISASTPGSNLSFAWTIPSIDSTTVRVKVEDVNDNTVSDASNADFTVKPTVTLTAPNGGESWVVGASQNITWTKAGTIANVKLVYSTDAGVTFPESAPDNTIVASTPGANLSYAWTVPDKIGTQLRVKIVKTDDASVVDTSDANFTIKGSLNLTAPNGGETWIVGTSQNVTWTRTGSIANVKLEYSKNAFTNESQTFTLVASTAAAAGSYSWSVSDAIGTNLKVRVSDASDSSVNDVSDAAFTVKGSLALTAPNGGETWTVSSSQNVTWTRTGSITNVKLVYSTDGGGTFPESTPDNTIIGSTDAATGSYSWTIPDRIGNTVRVRVYDAADASVYDDSNANFKIAGGLTLTAPNGGEKWAVNTNQTITWTRTGTVANVKIEYSTDGGSSYPNPANLIIASTPGGNLSYTWTIPDSPTATARVRILDASDLNVFDVSNANFKIRASVTVTGPDGGEVWTVGSGQTIAWSNVGTIANVKVEYSTDGGSSYPNVVTASTANTGAYSWSVPDAISTTVRVKVSDAGDVDAFDASNANFKIRGALSLTAPNGGEQWNINSAQNITWTRTGSIANVKLVYSVDSGANYPEPANVIIASTPGSDLSYAWTIPDTAVTTARVKIFDAADATVLDTSNADFSIKGAFTLTSPNGGETWIVGSSHNITWSTTGTVANVKLTYATDGGTNFSNTITNSTANTGSYAWTVPDAVGTQLRVKVADTLDANASDASNANFTIKGSLTLTAPNGSEVLTVNGSQNITWTKTGTIPNVKLEYSTDGGSTYPGGGQVIVASTPGSDLSYAWTVADAIGSQLRVKITNVDDSSVNDQSNANFSIRGALTLTAPNGGETWIVAASQNITWTKQGSIANVKLEYSKNGFADELQTFTISASTAAAPLTYAWTVADAIGASLKVRVSDALDAAVNDVSNATFTVKGALVLTAPNGGQTWQVNTSQNITWTRTGSISNVKLDYSGDSGATFPSAITASTDASTGTYSWTLPVGAVLSTQARIRVTDASDATVYDDSNADFNIVGALALTAPNGGEIWAYNSSQNITWTKTGSIANVKLEYSTNGGTSYPNVIIASTGAAAQSYSWTVPNEHSATVRVKVSDAAAAFTSIVNDASDANFKIRSNVTLTAPDGGEVWTVGSGQTVTWSSSGTVNNVKLDYSTNGGTSYGFAVTASTPNTGSYSWTIPDAISTTLKVKITDVDDVDASDVSNGNFKVRGALTVTAPNGGEQWGISTSKNVTWTRTGSIANVKLDYSLDSGTLYDGVIVASTGAVAGTYAWTIPDFPSTTARVRVQDASDASVLDTSNANFSIKGSVNVTAPNGGETWIVGADNNITWTKFGSINNVEIRYSENNGSTWPAGNIIVASTGAAAGTYTWTIPDKIGNNVLVRITDAADGSTFDDSNAVFSIKGSLTVTSPNGAEVWTVGEARNITWTKTGTLGNAKIEMSVNGGSTYPTEIINPVAAVDGTYAWTVPDAIGSQVRVKITLLSDTAVNDASDANFTVKGSLTLNAPNGSEVWTVGSTQPITWSPVGSIANVELKYSVNGGVSYDTTITASTGAAAGSYGWTVPDAITTTARVKVTDTTDATVTDTSNANFKITGSLTLTAPNGGEAWLVGGSQNITWSRSGSIANVKLEYSTNSGTSYPNQITASTDATTGTYAWTIPDAPTTGARVKITNTSDSTVTDASNADFNIRGTLTVTAPNGSEVWVVGDQQNITWTKTGSISNVELRYSTNGGTSYSNVIVASTAAGALTYAWTIPDAISSTARVKVTDTTDSAVTDTSDANFKIKGAVTLTAPNGSETWVVNATQNITWTRVGSFANVKLDYSVDGGSDGYANAITASAPAAPLSYAWTIPDAIGAQLRVKVADAADAANVSDTSDANFTIKGSLTLNAPNGGETWIVGATQNITWAKTGTLGNVKLEYSTNSGVAYPNVITASVPASDLTYAWTVPDAISSAVRVKVTLLADTAVNDASNADFSIKGSFTLTSPNGNEVWIVGETRSITWTKTGSISTARLDYSTNGGVSYPNVITASTGAGGLSFLWTVPDNMSTSVKVRIQNTGDSSVEDFSNADFKIAGSLTLTAPNGGEKWPSGSSQVVTWTKTGSIANAKLEYSTDGGSTFPNLIVATTPAGNLSYAWTLGSTTSTQVKVKISDVSDSTVNDVSNANFKIMGGFAMTAPNGGEVWVVGTSQNITWNTSGSVANIRLDYSLDGGTTFPNAITASATNTGSFGWTIPDAIGTTLRVKVEDVLDSDANDSSDANFKIKGSVTVTAPNGGETWDVGSTQNITWTRTGTFSNVKIEYSTDGGTNYPGGGQVLASSYNAAAGTYSWTVPDVITTTLRVRISDVGDATVLDQSNANFTIRGAFTLTAPNGGEKWKTGSTQVISWTTFGTIPNVKLEYSTDGGSSYSNTITASAANAGAYNWTVPNAIGTTARVRVSNAADPGTFDSSNANFKIMANFTVTAPDGGEVLVAGNSYSIAWTNQGSVSNVELKYSTNSGATYTNTISASASNSGTFSWTVPDQISSTLRVRVADALDTTDAFDASNADFKIRAGFTVTAPNGGEAWVVNTSHNITWTTNGTVANVKLEYSIDAGSNYTNVTGSVANTGTYAWTIPDAITTQGRVRVSDVTDSTANDASNSNFKIQGSLVITAPNGGEKWTVGTARSITWDRTGSISNVKLDFSTNGGSIYAPITGSASNTGSYSWTIPDNVSTNSLVKVTDANDATVTDVSDAAFKIQAGFIITAPNGGEVWGIGSSRNITWTTNGTVSFVKIDYSSDSGANYSGSITNSTDNTGSFSWTVPDVISGTMRVKVSQTTDSEAFDTSDGNFRIRATLGLIAPNGAEVWRVGQSKNITWTVSGTIPNVKLQYSRDGFNVDIQNINAAAPQTGTYSWAIPDSISNTVRVRVSDPNDIGAFDDSNADFRIIANFTVTSPNGSEQWAVGSAQTITWTSAGSMPNVKLEYSTNSGGSWSAILGSTTNDGTQSWTIPDAISANARVRVSDPADATSFDDSDNDFKIKSLFGLTAPNGGEVWTVNQVQNITWTNTGTVPLVKLTYSTNGGGTYSGTVSASASNSGTFAWTIPDAISTGVRVKVESTTDVDAYDTSDADFKIRGALNLTSPNGGEAWGIAQNKSITWATTGTIPNVKLTYSTNGGSTFPNVIIASVANTNTYTWNVSDTPSILARVRVENVTDSSVFDDSNANFSIQGNFTLTAPNGGEAWTVNGIRNITWNWGGTIPNVKLTYSTDSGASYLNLIAASAPNGNGSSGSFNYAWTIPDAISNTVRVKIEDAIDAAVFDTSNADFKIQAGFNMVAPNGGERWVVNESRTIQWTTGGTVPTVKLEYSTDGGSIYANTIVASTANTGSYAWTIPNTLTAQARVKVTDTNDAAVFDVSDANFTINLYTVTFLVKDLLSNNSLDQITVNAADNIAPAYTWAESGLTSPIAKGLQYGTWSVTFTRISYGDQTVNVVVDRDQTVPVFMETQVVHLWEAATELAYNTDNDSLTVSSTLRRDGSTVTGATSCSVKFYDGSTLIKTLSNGGAPDVNGFYNFTWTAPTGLVAGKVYNVVSTMTISTGGTFNTPRTFSITDVKKLKDLETTVNNKLNVDLVTMQSNIRSDLLSQTGTITGALAAQTGAINTSLAAFETKSDVQINALKLRADEIKSAGSDLQKSSEDLNATNAKFSGSLILPSNVLIGDKNVKIQYRALPGLVPLLTLTALDTNSKTTVVLNAIPMVASTTQPDLYEYTLDKIASPPFTPGKKAGVVVEATTFKYDLQPEKGSVKNIEAGSFLVESTTLSTLEGLVASQSTSQIKEMMSTVIDAVRGVEASFAGGGSVVAALDSLNRKVDRLPQELAKQGGKQDIMEIKNTVNEVAEQMKKFAGDSVGADLADILGKALDESSSMKEIRKKSDKVQGAIEVTQQLMEQKLGGIDDPVVHAIYQ